MGGFIVKFKAEDLLPWGQRINERTRSGITADAWCKKNGFSRHEYYWNIILVKSKNKKELLIRKYTLRGHKLSFHLWPAPYKECF